MIDSIQNDTNSDENLVVSEHSVDPLQAAEPTPPQGQDGPIDGAEILRRQIKSLPTSPGVYRMLDAKGDLLYVG